MKSLERLHESCHFILVNSALLGLIFQHRNFLLASLLLAGLGDENDLTLQLMESVDRVFRRTADRIGVNQVTFAPVNRDLWNSKLTTGDVETTVVRGLLLDYDTELQLQRSGLSKGFLLSEWNAKAGPKYFVETVADVQKAVEQTAMAVTSRESIGCCYSDLTFSLGV
jgi:hypothetical protein